MRIPPKTLSDELRGLARDDALSKNTIGLPANPPVPPPTADNAELPTLVAPGHPIRPSPTLPVLSAFQEFLEADRARVRRRLWAVLAVNAFVVFVVVIAGVALGYRFFNKTAEAFSQVENELANLKNTATRDRQTIRAGLAKVSEETLTLRQQIDSTSADFESIRSRLLQQLDSYSNEMETLHKLATEIQQKVALLTQVKEPATESSPTSPPSAPLQNEDRPVALSKTLRWTLTPLGQEKGVTWCLPIPQE